MSLDEANMNIDQLVDAKEQLEIDLEKIVNEKIDTFFDATRTIIVGIDIELDSYRQMIASGRTSLVRNVTIKLYYRGTEIE
jgi:hypothetical protein